MTMNTGKLLLIITLIGFSLQTKAQDNVIDQIIWVVGDEAILKSDVEKTRMELQARGERIEGDPYCIIPEKLAIQKLYLDQAKIDSIDVPMTNINRNVALYEKEMIGNAGSKEKLEEYLGSPITQLREEWKDMMKNNYMVSEAQRNIVGKKSALTPSEVRKYFSQLPKDSLPYIPTTFEVQIITNDAQIPLPEVDRIKERLREFTRRVNSGETSFSTLAIMYSDDGSASNGGELGFMGRGEFVPEFASAAFALSDPQKVSNVVQTEYGFHIIQLIERRGDRGNFRHILLKPKASEEEVKKSINRLDSLLRDIKLNKYTFEDATALSFDKDTRKSEGLMVNRRESSNHGTPRFTLEELPKAIADVIKDMKVGEMSAPFKMRMANGHEGAAIVKLRRRTEGHLANVSDDYQALKEIVEERKQEEILAKWLQKKIQNTYIYIDPEWKGCAFKHSGWIKNK